MVLVTFTNWDSWSLHVLLLAVALQHSVPLRCASPFSPLPFQAEHFSLPRGTAAEAYL